MVYSKNPLVPCGEYTDGSEAVKYYVLDRVRFPNGSAYFNAKLPQRLGVTPYIVHNNCIIGIATYYSSLLLIDIDQGTTRK